METTRGVLLLLVLQAAPVGAATLTGDPSNYTSQLGKLKPGDTLSLKAGSYGKGLNVNNLAGTAAKPIDLSPFAAQTDHDRDFDGISKGGFTFRGAYAGAGKNPGWKLQAGIKSLAKPPPPADGGPTADAASPQDGSPAGDAAPGGDATGDAVGAGDGLQTGDRTGAGSTGAADDGCSCRVATERRWAGLGLAVLLCLLALMRRRPR